MAKKKKVVKKKKPTRNWSWSDDQQYLTEVGNLLARAVSARQEAQTFADGIHNRMLKKQALQLIQDYDIGVRSDQ
jgi:hypothetical protein